MHLTTSLLPALAALTLSFFSVAAADLIPWEAFSHGRLALQDVSIHFRYAGSGPPLLLVHGNPQHSVSWEHRNSYRPLINSMT